MARTDSVAQDLYTSVYKWSWRLVFIFSSSSLILIFLFMYLPICLVSNTADVNETHIADIIFIIIAQK